MPVTVPGTEELQMGTAVKGGRLRRVCRTSVKRLTNILPALYGGSEAHLRLIGFDCRPRKEAVIINVEKQQ
jgi:hypothetical protein